MKLNYCCLLGGIGRSKVGVAGGVDKAGIWVKVRVGLGLGPPPLGGEVALG